MKLNKIIIASSALLCLSSCDDLFEPAIENKQDISQMFKDKAEEIKAKLEEAGAAVTIK